MLYTLNYTVPNFLCDRHDTLTMWGVARLFQEVAGRHIDTAGLGFSQLITQGKAWVLCRAFYHVRRLPHEGEEITLRTWSRGDDGLFAFREYELVDAQGNVAVGSSSYWAVIDCASRKVTRLNGLMSVFEHHPESATGKLQLPRLRTPKTDAPLHPVATFPVKPSMIDHTGHVNNSEYVKWAFDYLPDEDLVHTPFDMSVEYLMESQPAEQISVCVTPSDNPLLFQISNPRALSTLLMLSVKLVDEGMRI